MSPRTWWGWAEEGSQRAELGAGAGGGVQTPEGMGRCPGLKEWPRRKPRNGLSLLCPQKEAACTALGEKGVFSYEAPVSPGQPVCRRAGWVGSSPALGRPADAMPGPALILHLWLSPLNPHSHLPSPCLLAGDREGATGTSWCSGGTGRLSWGPLVVALRRARATGSRGSG